MASVTTSTPIFPRLVIRKESWHFRYYLWIRSIWGAEEPKKTSLCPYCQTIFWASFFALLFSPAIVFGWVILKLFRLTYKGLDVMGLENFIDKIDGSPVGKFFEGASEKGMEESPALATIVVALATIVSITLLGITLCTLGWLGFQFIIHIPDIPWFLWGAIKEIGWGIIYIFYGIFCIFFAIGWCLNIAGWAILWVGHVLVDVLVDVLASRIFWNWVGFVLTAGALAMVVGFLSFKISQTAFGKMIWDKIIFKLNGYKEAKDKAAQRRKVQEETEKTDAATPPAQNAFSKNMSNILLGIGDMFENAWGGVRRWYSDDVNVGSAVTRVLTPVGLTWMWLKALKQGACPIVEFLDNETILAVERISKECEGHLDLRLEERYQYVLVQNEVNQDTLPTKQWLYTHFLDINSIDYEERPARIKTYIGQYILGQSTLSLLREALQTDINILDRQKDLLEMRERIRRQESEKEESNKVAEEQGTIPEAPKPLDQTGTDESSMVP